MVRQSSLAAGQRVWKRQPGGGVDRVRRLALDLVARALAVLARVGDRDRRRAASACRGGSACRRAPRPARARRSCRGTSRRSGRRRGGRRDEVVGDEDVGQRRARSWSVVEQVDDLRLDRDVERRDRLVEHDQRAGRAASARAMPIRWRWPPENSCGKRLRCSGFEADRARAARVSRGSQLVARHAARRAAASR